MTPSGHRNQGWSLWVVMAAAAITYAILSYLDDWISLPLREASSVIAGGLLDLIGYPITRDGTIISTANFRFEVVPACSGSTALKVLLALGVTWCGSHPYLTPLRRGMAIMAAVPIAVVVNGLRVAALVAIGDSLLHPVEGLAHEAIGVFTFLIAIAGLFLLGELLAHRQAVSSDTGTRWLRPLMITVLVAILAAPPALWCATAWWSSPLDHFGWVYLLIGSALTIWTWSRTGGGVAPRWAFFITTASLLVILGGALVEVFVAQAFGILGALAGIALWTGGWPRLRACLPFLAAIAVGFPVVGFVLTTRTGLEGPTMSLGLRSGLFLALAVSGIGMLRAAPRPASTSPARVSMVLVALLAAAVAVESAIVTGRGKAQPLRVEVSWLQGAWVGTALPVDEATAAMLGREYVDMRAYRRDPSAVVQLIMTTTGGDRHRAHPPEYCMTGAGWRIEHQEAFPMILNGVPVQLSRLALERQGVRQVMVYWFSDGHTVIDSYPTMLSIDTRRRLIGHRSDWALLRVIGEAADVDHFLQDFRPTIRTGTGDAPSGSESGAVPGP